MVNIHGYSSGISQAGRFEIRNSTSAYRETFPGGLIHARRACVIDVMGQAAASYGGELARADRVQLDLPTVEERSLQPRDHCAGAVPAEKTARLDPVADLEAGFTSDPDSQHLTILAQLY